MACAASLVASQAALPSAWAIRMRRSCWLSRLRKSRKRTCAPSSWYSEKYRCHWACHFAPVSAPRIPAMARNVLRRTSRPMPRASSVERLMLASWKSRMKLVIHHSGLICVRTAA